MEDRAGSDKADPRNDLCRDASVISEVLDRECIGEQGVHRCTEADEEIGAQSGWAMFQLTFQSD
jgi:hypothetical protein